MYWWTWDWRSNERLQLNWFEFIYIYIYTFTFTYQIHIDIIHLYEEIIWSIALEMCFIPSIFVFSCSNIGVFSNEINFCFSFISSNRVRIQQNKDNNLECVKSIGANFIIIFIHFFFKFCFLYSSIFTCPVLARVVLGPLNCHEFGIDCNFFCAWTSSWTTVTCKCRLKLTYANKPKTMWNFTLLDFVWQMVYEMIGSRV